jgi:hypothetical protein
MQTDATKVLTALSDETMNWENDTSIPLAVVYLVITCHVIKPNERDVDASRRSRSSKRLRYNEYHFSW